MITLHSTSPASDGQKTAAELLTDETAAAYIGGIEPRTIRSWRMSLGLPFVRLTPKVVRIRRADLDKWVARRQCAITRGAA
jgi:hypothetical protein